MLRKEWITKLTKLFEANFHHNMLHHHNNQTAKRFQQNGSTTDATYKGIRIGIDVSNTSVTTDLFDTDEEDEARLRFNLTVLQEEMDLMKSDVKSLKSQIATLKKTQHVKQSQRHMRMSGDDKDEKEATCSLRISYWNPTSSTGVADGKQLLNKTFTELEYQRLEEFFRPSSIGKGKQSSLCTCNI